MWFLKRSDFSRCYGPNVFQQVEPMATQTAYLDSVLCCWRTFNLHAIILDSTRAVRIHISTGHGFCFMIGRGSNLCLLGHLTGPFSCFFVKLFLSSIFNSVSFWTIISYLEINIEWADGNNIVEMGVFTDGNLHNTHFFLQKCTISQNKQFAVRKSCVVLSGSVEKWIKVTY